MTMAELALENAALTRTLAETRVLLNAMTRRVMELEETIKDNKAQREKRERDELEEAIYIVGGLKSADDYRAEMARSQKAAKPVKITICRGVVRRCR